MRELNPRAWSIDGECWCTRVDYDGYKEEWSGIAPVYAPDNRSKYIGEIEDTNIVVELPTGIKDKNGKEIYEGDIVEYVEGFYRAETGEFEDIKDTGIVVWNTEYSGFMILNFDGVYGTMGECEVIGNIHENPELLGEE